MSDLKIYVCFIDAEMCVSVRFENGVKCSGFVRACVRYCATAITRYYETISSMGICGKKNISNSFSQSGFEVLILIYHNGSILIPSLVCCAPPTSRYL